MESTCLKLRNVTEMRNKLNYRLEEEEEEEEDKKKRCVMSDSTFKSEKIHFRRFTNNPLSSFW